jgi:hypothetical protein
MMVLEIRNNVQGNQRPPSGGFFCGAGVATPWSAAIDIAEGADDTNDHNEWISYLHWGMVALERKSFN